MNHSQPILILASFALLLVTGCNGDYEAPLPNGYSVLRTNSCTTIIMKDTSTIVVAAKVTAIQVIGDLVIGQVESSPCSEVLGKERPGYFILNTANGDLAAGLARAAFDDRTAELKLPVPVDLRPPRTLPNKR